MPDKPPIFDSDALALCDEIRTEAECKMNARAREVMNERSVLLRVLPPRYITTDECQFASDTNDKPIKMFDKENGKTCRVLFDRIMTPRFTISIDDLRKRDSTNDMIDMLGGDTAIELDSKFVQITDLMVSAEANLLKLVPGKVLPETGKVQWWQISDTMNRNSLAQALKDVRKLFEPVVVVVGPKLAEAILRFSRGGVVDELPLEFTADGILWKVADPKSCSDEQAVRFYGQHEKVGRTYVLQDIKVYLDVKAGMIKYYADIVIGAVIADAAYVARVDFLEE